jgi:hypothetical protein
MTTPKPSPSAEACRVAHEYRLSQPDHFTLKSVEELARALDAFAAQRVDELFDAAQVFRKQRECACCDRVADVSNVCRDAAVARAVEAEREACLEIFERGFERCAVVQDVIDEIRARGGATK